MGIYLAVLAIIMLLGVGIKPNKSIARRKRFMFLTFFILIVIAALRKFTVGRDLNAHYYNSFFRIIQMTWSSAMANTNYEPGFVAFYKIIGIFTSNAQWMIALHAIFVIGITGWFIYKNSEDCVLSTFLFIAANTWFTDMTILRQTMAVAMGMIAVEIWKHKEWKVKRYVLYGLCVFLSIAFHSTGLIVLIYPIFDKIEFRKKNIFLSVIIVIFSFLLYDKVFQLASAILSIGKDYDEAYGTTGAVVNVISLYEFIVPVLCFAIACWSLIYQKRKKNSVLETGNAREAGIISDNQLIYLVLMLVICRTLRMRINIMGRMAQYFVPFLWIMFPRAINALRMSSNRRVIRYSIYILLSVAFIWMGYQSAQQLYGTVPYEFFWIS